MLGLNRASLGTLLAVLIGAGSMELLLYANGFLDHADNFSLLQDNFFAIYGYYGGALIGQHFDKPSG
jgi:hypothetical protein